MNLSGLPWYAQAVLLIILAVVAVFLFNEIVLPLIRLIVS